MWDDIYAFSKLRGPATQGTYELRCRKCWVLISIYWKQLISAWPLQEDSYQTAREISTEGYSKPLSSLEVVNLMKLLSAQLGRSQQRAMPSVPCKQTASKTLLFSSSGPLRTVQYIQMYESHRFLGQTSGATSADLFMKQYLQFPGRLINGLTTDKHYVQQHLHC